MNKLRRQIIKDLSRHIGISMPNKKSKGFLSKENGTNYLEYLKYLEHVEEQEIC